MEKDLILQNVSEAEGQLKEIIKKLKEQNDYDFFNFQLDIQHTMMHINTAYNIGTWSEEEIKNNYNNKFSELIRVPEDKYLIDHS